MILVTGVAKSGKSTVLNILSEVGYRTIDISSILAGSMCTRWNEHYASFDVVDEDCARALIDKSLMGCGRDCAVESIAYSLLDPSVVDVVLLIRRSPLELYRDYLSLNWPCIKIFNNLVSELTGSHAEEIRAMFGHKVRQVVYTRSLDELRRRIRLALEGVGEDVDWISVYGDSEELARILVEVESCISHG